MDERVALDADAVGGYLRDRGIADGPVEADPLGGGVSNRVVRARWDGDCLVLKQPLPNLAVEDDWPADVERVHNEAAAARAYAGVIEATGLAARVPGVRFEDEDDHVVGFECAPAGADTFKADLLAGRVDAGVARDVGRVLGAVHAAAAVDADLRERFGSKRPFEQLRLDPYHRTTAERHPDVADAIRAEAERVAGVERTLVHGDFSPKNVLVAGVPWILDFEVAHWGDPAFDVAFMCNHLFIKSVYNHRKQDEYIDAVREFVGAYRERVPWDVEAATAAELGVLMLARVDGKSPVEYVEAGPVADALRRIAKRALTTATETIEEFAALAREEAP
ncbi:MAG: phosphotransferase family protein [Halobacteriales archaeon]